MTNEKVEFHNKISPELQGSVLRGILGSIIGMIVCILAALLCSLEKINLIDAINEDECVSITIRIDGHKFWIGILDSFNEVRYIYDNLSGNENYIAVGGDDYPGWAICDDIELVKQILWNLFIMEHDITL